MTKEKWDMILSTTEPYNHIGLMKVRKGNVGTETIEASIIENGEPYDLTGLKIYFCAYFERFIPVEQEAVVVDAKNGKIFYTLNQYDMQGTLRFAYFKFMKANQLVGTTQNFSFRVISGIDDSCGDFGPYIQRMEDVLNAFEDVKEISTEEIRQIIESFNQQVIQQQKDFDQWFNQVREIIESIDPGGKIILELLGGRGGFDSLGERFDSLGERFDSLGERFDSLGERLDSEKAEVSAQLAHTTQGLLTNRNAKHALPLPTYEGSGQSVHPSVVNTPASFGGIGFTWYMAHTPYPNTNNEYENPSLLGSVNGEDWVNVGTNPIDKPTPEEIAEGAYMSDPEMIYKDGRLELVYRFNHAGKEVLYRKTSTTGTTWTERELIFDKDTFGHSVMSPSIIYEDGKYRMWTVVPSGTVHYYESITGRLGTWSSPKVVPIQYREGTGTHSPWHISVFKDSDAMYYLVLNAIIPNSTFMRHILIGKSSDGLSFNDTYTLMKPNNDSYAFDNNYLYRAMIVKRKGQYYLYYSAINGDGRWGIGLSKGNTIETIAGFDYRSWNASVSIPRIMTENLSVRGGGVLNSEELLFYTPGVKSVKLKNSFPNELNLLTEQGNPARFLSKEIGLSTGSTGGNIGPSGVQNVLQIRNNSNNGPGHLEVAHLLLKDTTNTLNVEGALRYSPTKKKLEFYNGTSWETVTSS